MSEKAVSVIIASLLLIGIAVAAAVLLYVFSIGMMGTLQSSGGSQMQDSLVLESYNWQTVSVLVLNMRNIGPSTLNMIQADYFINGVATTSVLTCGQALQPQGLCVISLTVPRVTVGVAYPVKIVLADGAVFAYSAVCGQSG